MKTAFWMLTGVASDLISKIPSTQSSQCHSVHHNKLDICRPWMPRIAWLLSRAIHLLLQYLTASITEASSIQIPEHRYIIHQV